MRPSHVLIIDDDERHAQVLAEALERESYSCRVATSGEEGLRRFREQPTDVVLTDLVMRDVDGLEILRRVKEADRDVRVVVITGHGSIPNVVEAMKAGASHYLEKPVNIQLLREVVRQQVASRLERLRNIELQKQLDRRFGFEGIIGHSRHMRRNFDILQRVAPTDSTVLITGESGTGKELVAKAIHNNSHRKSAPFVAINCAALAEGVLESELFGHEKGAFTGAIQRRQGVFEAADGGTLFLDELAEMPPATQVKLLRVIEERKVVRVGSNTPIHVNVRLIAATNKDLHRLVQEGRFREDLYFRLAVVAIDLPPLKERQADIPLLIDSFLRDFTRSRGEDIRGLSPQALRILMSYPWPGNVRELRNCIENMVTLSPGPTLEVEDLPPRIVDGVAGFPSPDGDSQPRTLEEVEREAIVDALAFAGGNREQAAKLLGASVRTLYRKIKKYRL